MEPILPPLAILFGSRTDPRGGELSLRSMGGSAVARQVALPGDAVQCSDADTTGLGDASTILPPEVHFGGDVRAYNERGSMGGESTVGSSWEVFPEERSCTTTLPPSPTTVLHRERTSKLAMRGTMVSVIVSLGVGATFR